MERHSSGFHVAEADLRIRGPGEVLGSTQAGKKSLAGLKVGWALRLPHTAPRLQLAALRRAICSGGRCTMARQRTVV